MLLVVVAPAGRAARLTTLTPAGLACWLTRALLAAAARSLLRSTLATICGGPVCLVAAYDTNANTGTCPLVYISTDPTN